MTPQNSINRILPIAKALASVWMSLAILIVTIMFLACASISPEKMSAMLGVAPAGLYRHWLMLTIAAMAGVNLISAMAISRRSGRKSAGAWLCHIGILILAAGAAWYACCAAQGQCVSSLDDGSWSAIDRIYISDRYAVYLSTDKGSSETQTPLPTMDLPGQTSLDLPIAGAPASVDVRAVAMVRNVRLEEQIETLAVEDGSGRREVKFNPSAPNGMNLQTKDYMLVYRPGTTVADAEKLIAASGDVADRQPTILIMTGPELSPLVAVVGGGKPWHKRFTGQMEVPVAEGFVRITPLSSSIHALPGAGGDVSDAVCIAVSAGDFYYSTYIPFTQFAHISPRRRIAVSGVGEIYLNFSRVSEPLKNRIRLTDPRYVPYPGTPLPKDFICQLTGDLPGSEPRELGLNRPVYFGEYKFTQGSWLPSPESARMIVLNASTSPGLTLVWISFIIISAGMGWSLLVVPMIDGSRRK